LAHNKLKAGDVLDVMRARKAGFWFLNFSKRPKMWWPLAAGSGITSDYEYLQQPYWSPIPNNLYLVLMGINPYKETMFYTDLGEGFNWNTQ